jgi:hypothetical protein
VGLFCFGRTRSYRFHPGINLSPDPVYDRAGNELLPDLDNHAMGTIFESRSAALTRKPMKRPASTLRDVVELMANLIFLPVTDWIFQPWRDRALDRVMIDLRVDFTELFKQYSDNPAFKRWLSDRNFQQTYSLSFR